MIGQIYTHIHRACVFKGVLFLVCYWQGLSFSSLDLDLGRFGFCNPSVLGSFLRFWVLSRNSPILSNKVWRWPRFKSHISHIDLFFLLVLLLAGGCGILIPYLVSSFIKDKFMQLLSAVFSRKRCRSVGSSQSFGYISSPCRVPAARMCLVCTCACIG